MLEFFGWYRLRENDEFIEYGRAYGADPQIVSKEGPRFLLVEDVNEATEMRAALLISAPVPGKNAPLDATDVVEIPVASPAKVKRRAAPARAAKKGRKRP
jgi:hypothetical protein